MTLYATIPELPAVDAVTGPEQIEAVQAGVPARITPQQITDWVRSNLPPIIWAAGDPDFVAPPGTLYSRTDATNSTNRLWVNVAGTMWAYFTASE